MLKWYFANLCTVAVATVVIAFVMWGVTSGIRPGWGTRVALFAIPVVLFLLVPLMSAYEDCQAELLEEDRKRAWKELGESREVCKKKDRLIELFLRQEHVDTGLRSLAKSYADAHDYAAMMSAGSHPINERSHDKVREFQDEFNQRANKSWAALNAFSSAAEGAKQGGFTVYEREEYLKAPGGVPV